MHYLIHILPDNKLRLEALALFLRTECGFIFVNSDADYLQDSTPQDVLDINTNGSDFHLVTTKRFRDALINESGEVWSDLLVYGYANLAFRRPNDTEEYRNEMRQIINIFTAARITLPRYLKLLDSIRKTTVTLYGGTLIDTNFGPSYPEIKKKMMIIDFERHLKAKRDVIETQLAPIDTPLFIKQLDALYPDLNFTQKYTYEERSYE